MHLKKVPRLPLFIRLQCLIPHDQQYGFYKNCLEYFLINLENQLFI